MDATFWRNRWASNEIGFHQRKTNGYLEEFWPTLGVEGQVFVPLCGKSRDMLWLADQGHEILGIELAEQALRDFLHENDLAAEPDRAGAFLRWQAGHFELLCGDFFALTPELTAGCRAFYDRAALIALPPALRQRYVQHLTTLMQPGVQGLLVSLEYPQEMKDGPPFCVPDAEVQALFGDAWRVEMLREDDMLHRNERFREAGVPYLLERAYRLTRR